MRACRYVRARMFGWVVWFDVRRVVGDFNEDLLFFVSSFLSTCFDELEGIKCL